MLRSLLLLVIGLGIVLSICDDASAQIFRSRFRGNFGSNYNLNFNVPSCQYPSYQPDFYGQGGFVQPQLQLVVDPQTGQMYYLQSRSNQEMATVPASAAAAVGPATPTFAVKPSNNSAKKSTRSNEDIFTTLSQSSRESKNVQPASLETPLTLEGPADVQTETAQPAPHTTPPNASETESDFIELEAPGRSNESTPESAEKSGS